MHRRFFARSIAICGFSVMSTLTMGALTEPVHAQAMQASGFNAYDPQWAVASPYMSAGFSNMFAGSSQHAYAAKFGAGTVGLYVASSDTGAGAFGSSGNVFSPLQQNWFAGLGNPASGTSFIGSY